MKSGGQDQLFGKRKKQHILILASGNNVRHMTIKPWMTGLFCCVFAVLSLGYVFGTFYLVIRDDLIGSAASRQARVQHEYEDRIAALRAQVDRVTSRQLLDQQMVEQKVDKLLAQQTALSSRKGKMGSILDRAETLGLNNKTSAQDKTAPREASLSERVNPFSKILTEKQPEQGLSLAYAPQPETASDQADRAFSKVTLSLKHVEQEQHDGIAHIITEASQAAASMDEILSPFRLPSLEETASIDNSDEAVGGPFVEPLHVSAFDKSLSELDNALDRFEQVRKMVVSYPFKNPAQGKTVTSQFGDRRDPFLGTWALHSGMDFRFATGEKVYPSAPGKVLSAGWAGGYGNMVEVDHGNGVSTRYAHLSRILVEAGDTVATTDTIGLAGSTGRSTGTHLHYEVRRNGRAVDPLTYLNAGQKLAAYIN